MARHPFKVYSIYKKKGQTPLEALSEFRAKLKLPENWKLTYTGRLDPMAEGVLIILANPSQKQREKYLGLPKTYEAEILFGVSTDSWDLLGIPKVHKINKSTEKFLLDLNYKINKSKILNSFIPSALLPVPPFSSVPINGKPGHMWARQNKKVKMPLREMKIKNIKFLNNKIISTPKLNAYINKSIRLVKGDFRQDNIFKAWQKVLIKSPSLFPTIKLRIDCESGTYVRSIAHVLGKKLKTGAVLFSLKRTRVGSHRLTSSLPL